MVDFTQGEFRRLDDDATLECHGVLKEGVVRRSMGLVAGALSLFGVVASDAAMAQTPGTASSFPAWAYPWAPDYKAPPDDGVPRHVSNSTATFTVTQERDLFFAPDWHPDDHPPMPDVIANGRQPDVRACGSCHRTEGTGGPENASLAGLPTSYIVQQMADYKSGARKFSGPHRSPVLLMTAIAKAATDTEVQAAAAYFSSLKPKANIKVVETDTVPATQIARVFYAIVKNGGTEPIGERIVEVPMDVDQFEHRTLARSSWRMFRLEVSQRVKPWPKPGHQAQRYLARPAMVWTLTVWMQYLGLPDVRPATSCVRCTTSNNIPGREAQAL